MDNKTEYKDQKMCAVQAPVTNNYNCRTVDTRASNEGSRRFHNHGEGPCPTMAFSWLIVHTRAFKTL